MAMHNPPHRDEMLHDMLPGLHIKIAEMARRLHFSSEMLSRLVNRRSPISSDPTVPL